VPAFGSDRISAPCNGANPAEPLPEPGSRTAEAEIRPDFLPLFARAQQGLRTELQVSERSNTSSRAAMLTTLAADGTATPMRTLAAQLAIGQSSLSGLIDRMVIDGLLERRPDPDDRRAYLIALTHKGSGERAEAVLARCRLNDRFCEGFADDELALVARWLAAIGARFADPDAR